MMKGDSEFFCKKRDSLPAPATEGVKATERGNANCTPIFIQASNFKRKGKDLFVIVIEKELRYIAPQKQSNRRVNGELVCV
ncbi:MAG: hypothetical protein ACRCYL_01905 [Kluyvera sp.]